MANRNIKQLNKGKSGLTENQQHNLDVMKPFLKFGINAMSAITHTLIGIVKSIPKPHHDDDRNGNDKIIKI